VASVEKARSKRGGYVVRYRGSDRKPRTQTFRRKIDADNFAKSVDTDVARGDWIDPAGGRMLLSELGAKYWATTVNLRPSTLARDEANYRNHVLPKFGEMRLSAIDHLTVQEWVANLTKDGLAPATVQKCHQVLAKVLRSAVKGGLIRLSPCEDIDLPRIEREEMRFLQPAEIAHLAEAMHERYRSLVYLGAYGGLRAGEMFGLRRSRLDLMRGRVDVAEIAVEVRGKLFYGPPKTRAGRRSVPLPRFVVDTLTAHAAKLEPTDLVFASPKGETVRASAFRRRFWVPACVATGLGELVEDDYGQKHYEGLRIHDLRHTAVSLWIAAGASPKEIAVRAGHSSVSVVLDRYGHLLPGHEDKVNDALEVLAREAARQTRDGGKLVALNADTRSA
jgi:integrase